MVKDAVPLGECGRALVVKLRHHGDVLLASPVLSVLKAHAPTLEVDALVYDTSDPDDAVIALTWAWTRDGEPTGITSSAVPAGETRRGETWRATVTASDDLGPVPAGAARMKRRGRLVSQASSADAVLGATRKCWR